MKRKRRAWKARALWLGTRLAWHRDGCLGQALGHEALQPCGQGLRPRSLPILLTRWLPAPSLIRSTFPQVALPSWGSSSKPLPLAQVTPPVQPPWGQLGGPWTTDTLTAWAAPSRHIPAPTPQPRGTPLLSSFLGGIDPHHHNTENVFQNHVSEHFYFGKEKLPFTCPHRGHCIPTAHRLPGKDSCWPSPGRMVLSTKARVPSVCLCPLYLPVCRPLEEGATAR